MNEYLVYQAYGNSAIIDECKFALLRLLHVYSARKLKLPNIIIYTDQPSAFRNLQDRLPLILEEISHEQINKWRGKIDFVHRVKIEVIKHCLTNFKGKILYADTDTVCLKPLDEVFNSITTNTVFFHEYEGTIDSHSQFKKWKKFLLSHHLPELETPSPLHIEMRNAGVIGLHPAHLPLLNEVLALTDKLHPLFTKHIVEQFSFCYVFQKHAINILDATNYFFHYWHLKEFRELLHNFFNKYNQKTVEEVAELAAKISPQKILADKTTFVKAGFFKKIVLLITGSGWKIGNYKF